MSQKRIIQILCAGGVGVLVTDTIYGLVGSAISPESVERIYKLRKRNKNKPMIVLISSFSDLKVFGVKLKAEESKFLHKYWPGKLSVILKVSSKKFYYLHRGTKSVAFRLPKSARLQKILEGAGPLVAPSANFEGKPPATTIREAKKYFKNNVDFYLDSGRLASKPSTLIDFRGKQPIVSRKGAVNLDILKEC